ncbi:MAG TPA: fumarylacetoacetase [Gemmatimonadaceae bacterium]|jgi:fumarylacetoacetase
MIDDTHNPELKSWVESANDPNSDFPIQNLPFGVFRRADSDETPRVGVAIGDQIFDLAAADLIRADALNGLMALGNAAATALRREVSRLLSADAEPMPDLLVPMNEAEMFLPAHIGDYTDFYASISHATNVGSMFRPDNPLLPNYKWVPIGYHGRASSIVVSGTPIPRPNGQTRDSAEGPPSFGPTNRLDYELEIGAFVAEGNAMGESIPIEHAEEHLFGLCLVNDWSARDVQTWEYQPLGPFLSKSFATTVSPWVVTRDALEPFRAAAFVRAEGDPAPLPHLSSQQDTKSGGFDITLEVRLTSAKMRDAGTEPMLVSRGKFAHMYWTIAQMLTHHASNGCNLRPGDLLASGTVSGPEKESRGCLLERTWRGSEPLTLPSGETRAFLQDGDEVTIRGYCISDGARRIGFGSCIGRVYSA